MCLSTVVKESNPDDIIMEYVSSLTVKGDSIILTDMMGEQKIVQGTLTFADLTGALIRIDTSN